MALLISYGLLFIFFISSFIATTPACRNIDQHSLRSSFDNDSSSLNWSSNDCCRWEGITCDMFGRVTHLLLPSKGIKGCISRSLGNLTHLSHLNLSHNMLSGPLEARIFLSLTHLQILDLSENHLSGKLPSSLSSSYIQMVDLSSNQFNGTIPSSFLQHAWNLSSLNVSNNHFTGQIPSSICLLSSSLRVLDFSHNNFSGSIPLGLGNCSQLEVFHARDNTLSGSLPADIYNAQALQEISLSINSLFGPIGENVGKLSKLKLMHLHYNNLEGPLPPSLMNCTNLVEINLGFNRFSGNISAHDFSKLTQLSKLDFINNALTGILPISLYSCKSLKALRLASNDFEGQIQPEILQLKNLTFLSLSHNRLTNVTGAMKIFTRFKSLRVLLLSENFRGEEMPDGDITIDFKLQDLCVFSLSTCHMTGQIPAWISRFRKLESLNLSFNRLTGTIPGWLGTLPSLFYLLLNDNLISGEFPRELCGLQALVLQKHANQTGHCSIELPVYFKRGNNATVLSSQFKYLANMPSVISLRNNSLSGSIPFEIGQLQYLQQLDLSINNFSGNIPDQISNLTELERLELNNNHLSGEIPSSLSSLHFLSTFTVAYNNLEGRIPAGTQLQGFDASAFEGNPKLCGTPLPNQCLSSNGNDADENENNQDLDDDEDQSLWVGLSVSLGFVVGFLGFCCPLLLKRTWRYVYFQFLDNVQFKLYMMWRRLGRRKLDGGAESTNCSEYASKGESFMVPDNFQTTSLFSVQLKLRAQKTNKYFCVRIETEILWCKITIKE
ncbi:receptor-like protein 2 isoform X3 [Malus sylvestris]|nr:receptor-like protein 2 isoform X3 [Malus sylvestris]